MRRFGIRRLGILLVLCSTAVPLAAASESAQQHAPQDVAACTPDAWRVCFHAFPDGDKVRACLFDNQPSLSEPCWNVIERGRLAERETKRHAPRSTPRSTAGRGSSTTGQGGQRTRY